jgi:hypothetical protein
MDQFSRVLFHVNLVDADLFLSPGRLDLHPAVMANGQIKLRDLIILRIVRIKIVLPVSID